MNSFYGTTFLWLILAAMGTTWFFFSFDTSFKIPSQHFFAETDEISQQKRGIQKEFFFRKENQSQQVVRFTSDSSHLKLSKGKILETMHSVECIAQEKFSFDLKLRKQQQLLCWKAKEAELDYQTMSFHGKGLEIFHSLIEGEQMPKNFSEATKNSLLKIHAAKGSATIFNQSNQL